MMPLRDKFWIIFICWHMRIISLVRNFFLTVVRHAHPSSWLFWMKQIPWHQVLRFELLYSSLYVSVNWLWNCALWKWYFNFFFLNNRQPWEEPWRRRQKPQDFVLFVTMWAGNDIEKNCNLQSSNNWVIVF